jgi:DNA-binding MltR family transcriptional regulator
MSRKSLKALSRKPITPFELGVLVHELPKMSAQAEVVISVSQLEDIMKEAIMNKMRQNLSNSDMAALFENQAPLATFSARVTMLYALGIIGQKTRADLDCIKDIRNVFAHSRLPLDFDTPEVREAVFTLDTPQRVPTPSGAPRPKLKDARHLFRTCLQVIWMHLRGDRRPSGVPLLDC